MSFVFQRKESKMLNRTLFVSVFAAVVCTLLLVYAVPVYAVPVYAVPAAAGEQVEIRHVVRGQGQNDSRRNPTLFDRMRDGWNRFLSDDDSNSPNTTRPAPVVTPGVPTQPPRPLTIEEIRQATGTPHQGQRPGNANTAGASGTAETGPATPRTGTSSIANVVSADRNEESEVSTLTRMQEFRSAFFPNPAALEAAAKVTRAETTARNTLVPLASELVESQTQRQEQGTQGRNTQSDFTRNLGNFAELSAAPDSPVLPSERIGADTGRTVNLQAVSARNELTVPQQIAANPVIPQQIIDPFSPATLASPHQLTAPQQIAEQRNIVLDFETPADETTQRLVSRSPILKIEVEKPDHVSVGQEIIYRIRVANVGDAQAEGVVVNTEIPSWVDIRHKDASDGELVAHRRGDGSGNTELIWRVNRIAPGATDILVLGLVSHQRQAIELPIRHDFHRPAIVAKVTVREPKLEMELRGANEVLWNEVVLYKLVIRNVGNGDAENIRLDLLQTSAGESSHEFTEPLRPGDISELDIKVQAGREREFIDIAVVASGAHDVRADVQRRIQVLRPKLEMNVQTLPLHFVDSPAEFVVRVRNTGSANADDVTIRADLPLGMQYQSSSDDGAYSIQQQQHIVEWRRKAIPAGETRTFRLVCEPKREGNSRISVEASESGGELLASSSSTFSTEAFVDLDLVVHAPRGPIELGQEVEYEIQVTNVGTKSAENVEILIMFGHQLSPSATRGGSKAGVTDDGQVAFEMIPAIFPKQTVTVNVVVEARGVGTVPIRAEVVRTDANGMPVNVQRGLSAHIFSRTAASAERDVF